MKKLDQLEPHSVWYYFEKICAIPRISRHEEKIQDYLMDFAHMNGLIPKKDQTGNILIVREASVGFEHRPTLVLQSHIDIVGAKSAESKHNFLSDPIEPIIEGGWVTAKETTLGADDGIGIAAQLAILSDFNRPTPKLEALFTVDEETGMTGARNMDPNFFTGKTLINLDSEDEGILFIGCAGGIDTIGVTEYRPEHPSPDCIALELVVSGLHGGHSGDEIHKGYGNAIKILNSILLLISENIDINLNCLNGGILRNAIPREAKAIITCDKSKLSLLKSMVEKLQEDFVAEFKMTEKEISFYLTRVEIPKYVVDEVSTKSMFRAIAKCPNGVQEWSSSIPGLVQTSSNLAIVEFTDTNKIRIVTSQRSAVESSLLTIYKSVENCFENEGFVTSHSDGYPGWEPNMDSAILDYTKEAYSRLFGKTPEVTAIHAGLECGLFFKKIKDIDMISFGPTIKGAHTTEEKMEIITVNMFWDLLMDIITNYGR